MGVDKTYLPTFITTQQLTINLDIWCLFIYKLGTISQISYVFSIWRWEGNLIYGRLAPYGWENKVIWSARWLGPVRLIRGYKLITETWLGRGNHVNSQHQHLGLTYIWLLNTKISRVYIFKSALCCLVSFDWRLLNVTTITNEVSKRRYLVATR